MKKITLLFIIVPLSIMSLTAQIYIGPTARVTFSTVSHLINSSSNVKSPSYIIPPLIGMQDGITINITNGKAFSFQCGVLYIQKGYIIEAKSNKNVFSKFNKNYVEVPLMFKFSYGGSKVKGFFDFGPYTSVGLDGKFTHRDDPNDPITEESGSYHPFDIGISFGGGVSYCVGKDKLVLDLRFDLGFVNQDFADPLANRTAGISLTYLFYIKERTKINKSVKK